MFTDVVYSSILKTKHSTVLVTCDQPAPHMPHNGHRVQLYDLRALNIDRWRHCIGVYPWGSLLQCYDIEHLYVNFLEIIQHTDLESRPQIPRPRPEGSRPRP